MGAGDDEIDRSGDAQGAGNPEPNVNTRPVQHTNEVDCELWDYNFRCSAIHAPGDICKTRVNEPKGGDPISVAPVAPDPDAPMVIATLPAGVTVRRVMPFGDKLLVDCDDRVRAFDKDGAEIDLTECAPNETVMIDARNYNHVITIAPAPPQLSILTDDQIRDWCAAHGRPVAAPTPPAFIDPKPKSLHAALAQGPRTHKAVNRYRAPWGE